MKQKEMTKKGAANANVIWILVIILVLVGVFLLFKINVTFNSRFSIAGTTCNFVGTQCSTNDVSLLTCTNGVWAASYVNGLCGYTGSNSNPTCTPSWSCSGFGTCSNNIQTRTCTDSNNCGTTSGEPSLTQSCTTSGSNGNTNTNSCSFMTNINPTSITDYDKSGTEVALVVNGIEQNYIWIGDMPYNCNSPELGNVVTGPFPVSSIKATGGYTIRTSYSGLNSQIIICDNSNAINFNPTTSFNLQCNGTTTGGTTTGGTTTGGTTTGGTTTNTNTGFNLGFLTTTIFSLGNFAVQLWMLIVVIILILALFVGGKK